MEARPVNSNEGKVAYEIDYLSLKKLQAKAGKKLFIELPENVTNIDECIQTAMESVGYNNPSVRIQLATKSTEETAKFMCEFPRPFATDYLDSPIGAGSRARKVIFVKDPLEMEPKKLLEIRNSSASDNVSVYLFGQKKTTQTANFLCHELREAGFIFLRAPCHEVKL